MKTVTIIDTSTGKEIDVSDKAFDTIYREKGFVLKQSSTEEESKTPSSKEAKDDGAKGHGQAGESSVSTGSSSTRSAAGSDQGSVRSRKGGKDKSPAGT